MERGREYRQCITNTGHRSWGFEDNVHLDKYIEELSADRAKYEAWEYFCLRGTKGGDKQIIMNDGVSIIQTILLGEFICQTGHWNSSTLRDGCLQSSFNSSSYPSLHLTIWSERILEGICKWETDDCQIRHQTDLMTKVLTASETRT